MQGHRGLRSAAGKNGWIPFKNLKPRAEGFETEVLTKCTFGDAENHLTCMRKPHTFYTLTVSVVARDEARTRRLRATIFHCTSPQGERSSTTAVTEVQQRNILNNKQNRARKISTNGLIWPLREGREVWEVWEADGTFASIRRRHENVEGGIRAISQLIDVIL